MGVAIIIIAVIVVAAVAIAWGVRRKRGAGPVEADAPSPRPPRPEPEPMHGLEDALNRVTDRSGTTMADRLDAEGTHVDELRVSDDTGPLLRRALDHVTPHDPPTGTDETRDDAHGDAHDAHDGQHGTGEHDDTTA